MFICPKCRHRMTLPACSHCGCTIPQKDNIWQLTDAPDMVTEGDGDKYIGYEHIGESYSGNRKYLLEERNVLFAKEISAINGDGIFLDLACGDGCFTVPCAQNGLKIIAGDISNAMMRILQARAEHNHISLENVTLCRMNALDIPLADESIDTVVANSMLHLLSNPQRVISEIHRVLKKGGSFVCQDDQPGKSRYYEADNRKYHEILNAFYGGYWDKLMAQGIRPKKYSWKFDRASLCDSLFSRKEEKLIERGAPYKEALQDGFLPRFTGRGFSDQTCVPKDVHDKAIEELMAEAMQKYGEDFGSTPFHGIEEDMLITIYKK